ncbi:MAG: MFS transporter [Pseudomonadota bacterium]
MTSMTAVYSPRILIMSLSTANFAVGMGAFVVIGVLSPIIADFDLTSASAGWIMTAYAIAYAIGSPLAVALTGSMGRRTVMTVGLAIFTGAMLLAALAPAFEVLVLARIFAALGAGVISPVAAGVAAAASKPEERGKALAAAFFGLTLAQVLGVPVGAWLGYSFGWQTVFVITALLSLIALVAIWRIVPRDMAFQVNSLGSLGAALTDPKTILAILFTVFTMGAVYTLYTYTAPVLEARMGFGRDGVSLYLLGFGLGAVVGNLLGGWMTDRVGAFRTLVFVSLAHIVLMPVFAVLPLPHWLLYAHCFVWSVAGWSFAASQQFRLVSLGPERANVMLALNAAAIYVGVSFGSAIGGATIDLLGLDALGLVGSFIAVLALITLALSERIAR